jgi:UDP-N-acetylmuramoyl-tripeptide--D-alanyl-D-alanine ligase
MPVSGLDLASIALHIEHAVTEIRERSFGSFAIDSRTMEEGAVFFAIRGERRDGHEFVAESSKRAGAVVVDERWWSETGRSITGISSPVIVVPDTVKALGSLARLHRRRYPIPVVAVTGSSGKTTTKEMIVQVLAEKYKVHRTKGNFNNHLGLPLTLGTMTADDEISVIEIGMNHPGEIEYLCMIAEPTHGLITNIGKGHLGFFDSIEDVAREKGMLFRWLGADPGRMAIVNADDTRVLKQAGPVARQLRYGIGSKDVDIRGVIDSSDKNGCYTFTVADAGSDRSYSVKLTVPGRHQVRNALAAAAVGSRFGVEPAAIAGALSRFNAPDKRMVVRQVGPFTIVDDTYNANPDSTGAALELFREMKVGGKKIVVLGDMLELGSQSGGEHGRIGLLVAEMGFEYLFTYGTEAETIQASAALSFGGHYKDKKELVHDLIEILSKGDAILIKGSRGMRMEEVIQILERQVTNRNE